jgi:putative DNA primase/helicase
MELLLKLNHRSASPDDEDNVTSTINSVYRYQAAPPMDSWTDVGLSSAFLREHRDHIRYSEESCQWYYYNGTTWRGEYTLKGTFLNKNAMDLFVGFLKGYASTIPDDDENRDKFLKYLKEYESMGKMQSFFKGLAAQTAASELDFDRNPYIFNCNNTAIDLRTCTAVPHDKNLMLSKASPVDYDPAAQCPTWLAFVDRIFDHNTNLIKYIQTALGYTMIGRVKEKALFLMVGEGDNGKSRFLEAVGNIFDVDRDQYGTYCNFSTFTTARDGEIRGDLAALRGARYVFASEGKYDAYFDDTIIKSITGDDRIRARYLYQNEVVFKPTFKVWLATNKLPQTRSTEKAMRVRIKLINFNISIPREEQDTSLGDKLKAEASGILNWILEGVKTYNAEGLRDCETVLLDTKEYMDSMDDYKHFYEETLVYKEGVCVEARALFDAFSAWRKARKKQEMSETRFGMEFASHMKKTHGVNIIKDTTGRRSNGAHFTRYFNIDFADREF